ncbi:MAG: hypothetical protein AABZ74_06970 [Cyanobacteriota bacterium]
MVDKMQILEKSIQEYPISVNTITKEVIDIILLGVKDAITRISPTDSLKQTLANKLGLFINSQLEGSNIAYIDNPELLLYLSEHFEVVQDIIKACQETRKKFGADIQMQLELTNEIDKSGACSLSLLLLFPEYDEETHKTIKAFGRQYTSHLLQYGVLFSITDEYLTA